MAWRAERAAHLAAAAITTLIALYVAHLLHVGNVPQQQQGGPRASPQIFQVSYFIELPLPMPRRITNVTVEEAILRRRSIREYAEEPLSLEELSMLLWAAYGITDVERGFRAVPSAGATYPLEVYVVIGERGVRFNATSYLAAGVYKYRAESHSLWLVRGGDVRGELAGAALGQRWVREAPVSIVIAALFERTARVYGERGRLRYVPMEVGHAGQNVYLMATALGLGAVVVGAFFDEQVMEILSLPPDEVPMYIVPVGVPRKVRVTTFEELHRFIEAVRARNRG